MPSSSSTFKLYNFEAISSVRNYFAFRFQSETDRTVKHDTDNDQLTNKIIDDNKDSPFFRTTPLNLLGF